MTLPAFAKRLDDLPASMSGLYVKSKNGWTLDVEPVDGFELVDANALRADSDRLFAALETQMRDAEIAKAVAAAGGNETLLRPHLAQRITVDRKTLAVKVVDGEGKPYWNLKGQPGSLVDVIGDMRRREDFRLAFDDKADEAIHTTEPKPALWGGKTFTEHLKGIKSERDVAKPPIEIVGNPWAKPSFNLTHQMQIMKADPSRAAMLRAEAERSR